MPSEENYTTEVSKKEQETDVESMTHEGINCESPTQEINKKTPHMPTMVSTHAKCVLPSWTRRYKLSIQTLKQLIPKITGKKRELLISRDYVELTPKRLQISHNVDEAPIILAAVDH